VRQAGGVKRVTIAALTATALLAACGGEASESVGIPGAPPGGDTRPPISIATRPTEPVADSIPTEPATTTSTEPAPTTSAAPSTTTATSEPPATEPTSTTTVPATTTTVAPTTTELVYEAEPVEGPLRVGVEGPRSLLVQQQLITLGILPSTAADSKYGPGTAGGVRRFQESKGLVVDGVAGPNTQAALAEAVAAASAPPDTAPTTDA